MLCYGWDQLLVELAKDWCFWNILTNFWQLICSQCHGDEVSCYVALDIRTSITDRLNTLNDTQTNHKRWWIWLPCGRLKAFKVSECVWSGFVVSLTSRVSPTACRFSTLKFPFSHSDIFHFCKWRAAFRVISPIVSIWITLLLRLFDSWYS